MNVTDDQALERYRDLLRTNAVADWTHEHGGTYEDGSAWALCAGCTKPIPVELLSAEGIEASEVERVDEVFGLPVFVGTSAVRVLCPSCATPQAQATDATSTDATS